MRLFALIGLTAMIVVATPAAAQQAVGADHGCDQACQAAAAEEERLREAERERLLAEEARLAAQRQRLAELEAQAERAQAERERGELNRVITVTSNVGPLSGPFAHSPDQIGPPVMPDTDLIDRSPSRDRGGPQFPTDGNSTWLLVRCDEFPIRATVRLGRVDITLSRQARRGTTYDDCIRYNEIYLEAMSSIDVIPREEFDYRGICYRIVGVNIEPFAHTDGWWYADGDGQLFTGSGEQVSIREWNDYRDGCEAI